MKAVSTQQSAVSRKSNNEAAWIIVAGMLLCCLLVSMFLTQRSIRQTREAIAQAEAAKKELRQVYSGMCGKGAQR